MRRIQVLRNARSSFRASEVNILTRYHLIHIIVRDSKVKLTGVVQNIGDKTILRPDRKHSRWNV